MEKEIQDGEIVNEISGYYQVVTKDNDGEAHIHTLEKHSTKVRPSPEDIEDSLIRQAPPSKITPSRRAKHGRADKLALFLPDAQIPFQDEKAMKLAQTAVVETMPDEVVLLGDMLDFPSLSRFEQRPEYSGNIQQSIDYLHTFIAQIRSDAPDAIISYILGNHEERLHKHIVNNNAEFLGIKRANAEQELGMFTLGHLLRTEELEVDLYSGYPGATYWLSPNLRATHGDIVRSNGSTASPMINKDPTSSVWFGHVHRQELQWKTTPTQEGNIQRYAATPGTLARIDGLVPSYGSSIDEGGNMVPRAENWQQGIGLAEFNEKGSNPNLIHFDDGEMMIEGKLYSVR